MTDKNESIDPSSNQITPSKFHKFWSTQPVPQFNTALLKDGPYIPFIFLKRIEADKLPNEIKQIPYPLPEQFEWYVVDLTIEEECKSIYELLTENYVEDDEAMFRFNYSADFLKWGLMPPGYNKDWHIAVRVIATKRMVAFISGIPLDMRLKEHHQRLVEINFLCIHKKLRSKRLSPVLIQEITRRIHLTAVYTAGATLPKPLATCRYYHRSLNPKKLIEVGFSHLSRTTTMAKTIKHYKLPQNPITPGLRPMESKDVSETTLILSSFLSQFSLSPIFSKEEVAYWFLPRDKVIYSYVSEDPQTNKVNQLTHIYRFNSHVPLNNGMDPNDTRRLIQDALILAKQEGFDVFNSLELMGNNVFLEDCKFAKGDGSLNYYLYNYQLSVDGGDAIGFTML